ncbi:Putative deoxyribonuclease YjjV [uncultured Gammaproteobacteria bacterium]|jgi:TatD DNase family protein|nr:Putative deoxyribonuclease YjjV [Bathymodiolus brooksi thiotrophic gill symbiont]CAC9552779.1 Putative deoxyribonuclease YjjV [uncultured Gammaproteobacteria bacterium]CAB9543589.1 Putative deoxyribonuclease YjjV [Bathymodiolus brooksi thiotrophic gill symbiont]CAC9558220.1 Putative deoxyribonuclease YjjV [uncultured Gammaproteobacteria bacterium]CAC9954235.1 Putative deoxyribonuclease YjjV [uncultured Gammaproteobacteria bacterium]
MINSHAHLDFDEAREIAENAVAIVPSIGSQNWTDVQMYPYFALGIHPWMVAHHQQQDLNNLEYLIKCNNPVAIGECGLDYIRDINKKQQLHFFVSQLEMAQKYNLPVIIHAVKSTEDVIFLLRKYPKVKGEIHGFSGSEQQANTLIKMGFYLGFGVQIIDQKSTRLRSLVQNLPLTSLLIETDDGNPQDLPLVAQCCAELKQISVEKLIEQCDNNAIKLFGLEER